MAGGAGWGRAGRAVVALCHVVLMLRRVVLVFYSCRVLLVLSRVVSRCFLGCIWLQDIWD